MAKQNKTICIDPDVIKAGQKMADKKTKGSFSQYVEDLISEDAKHANK